jgi:hypothetical protein
VRFPFLHIYCTLTNGHTRVVHYQPPLPLFTTITSIYLLINVSLSIAGAAAIHCSAATGSLRVLCWPIHGPTRRRAYVPVSKRPFHADFVPAFSSEKDDVYDTQERKASITSVDVGGTVVGERRFLPALMMDRGMLVALLDPTVAMLAEGPTGSVGDALLCATPVLRVTGSSLLALFGVAGADATQAIHRSHQLDHTVLQYRIGRRQATCTRPRAPRFS